MNSIDTHSFISYERNLPEAKLWYQQLWNHLWCTKEPQISHLHVTKQPTKRSKKINYQPIINKQNKNSNIINEKLINNNITNDKLINSNIINSIVMSICVHIKETKTKQNMVHRLMVDNMWDWNIVKQRKRLLYNYQCHSQREGRQYQQKKQVEGHKDFSMKGKDIL